MFIKVRRDTLIILMLAFMMSLAMGQPSYAANATRFLGFSSRDSAMAGATTASSEDTSCLVKNPAGLVRIGNKIDVEYQNIFLHDVTMHTEGPGLAALGGAPFVNAGLRQKSTANYLPGGNAGISYSIPGMDEYPVSVGFGMFTIGGVASNYPSSRMNTALTGDYDKMVDLRSMRMAPGVAVAFTDKLSFGITGNFTMQALRANLATTGVSNGHYTETSGGGKWSFAPGGGFTVGLLYKINDMFNVGTTYESHTWMGHHYRYKDCLPFIDEPPVASIGVSFKPIKDLELTYDTRYINWTDVKLARNGPASGGFGWGDQWVFAVGSEYTTLSDKLKLRLGYNYGKSPIQEHVIFANALLGVILEHHLTTGFSYFLTKNLSLDFVWEHHFKNVMADNGHGDVYSVNGSGTKVSATAELIGIGFGYKF